MNLPGNSRQSVEDKVTLRGGPRNGEQIAVSTTTRTVGMQGLPGKSRHLAMYDQLPDDPLTFQFVGYKPTRMGP